MDYSDIESGEDNYYSDNGADDDYEFAEENKDSSSSRSQLGYVALKEEDIRRHQKDDIEQVSTVLSLSQPEAIALLLYYRWIVNKVQEEWFTDEERVRKLVGLLKEPVVIDAAAANGKKVKTICGICFESYTQRSILKVSCGHPYCKTCWTKYITAKIREGPDCLRVKCPEPSCTAIVGQDMIEKVAKKEDKEKYDTYFLRSYVEEGANEMKWCPSPGCEYAIDFGTGSDSGSSSFDVSCLCSHTFCWNCCEDAHRPVDCETVAKWIFKNNDEAENTNWILVNSKPCPKCRRPIEKNKGCMHMTCSSPCKHQFCWTCLSDWKGHNGCNKYTSSEIDEAENKRIKAKTLLDRYSHYYERWANNQSSRLKAMQDLKKLESVQFKGLSNRLALPETQLQFTVEAWLQIIECRRVLKWTYAYGYYLPEHERAKKQLFEYLQGEAETGLERLHYCAETELNQFVRETDAPSPKSFDDFRVKLTALTKVTKTYFENLVKALQNGLSDVEAHNESKTRRPTKPPTKRQKLLIRK